MVDITSVQYPLGTYMARARRTERHDFGPRENWMRCRSSIIYSPPRTRRPPSRVGESSPELRQLLPEGQIAVFSCRGFFFLAVQYPSSLYVPLPRIRVGVTLRCVNPISASGRSTRSRISGPSTLHRFSTTNSPLASQ